MDWGAVDLLLLVVGLLLGAALCLLLLVRLARRTTPATETAAMGWEPFEQTLDTELERARRFERPLTLVRIPLDSALDASDARSLLARIQLRRIDHTFVLADAALLIAPDTGVAARSALIHRIRSAQDGQGPLALYAATFPDEGLSSGALLARLEQPGGIDGTGPITDQRNTA